MRILELSVATRMDRWERGIYSAGAVRCQPSGGINSALPKKSEMRTRLLVEAISSVMTLFFTHWTFLGLEIVWIVPWPSRRNRKARERIRLTEPNFRDTVRNCGKAIE